MNNRVFFFACLILLISVSCQKEVTYEVYALKFREFGMQPTQGSVTGATVNDSVDLCFMIWFLKGNNGQNVLVDAGDTDAGPGNFIMPADVLKELNIDVSDITDIIITHPHHDHIGGLTQFPYGKVWMQKTDYEYFIKDAWLGDNHRAGLDTNDVKYIRSVDASGRLNLVDGDDIEIMPGIRVFTGSSHTKENQYLLVNSDTGKKILLASDAIWFYQNLEKLVPIETYLLDPVKYVDAMKRMKTLVDNERYIIPGHDNRVFSMFTPISERVVKIE